jgi:hypothetical protein
LFHSSLYTCFLIFLPFFVCLCPSLSATFSSLFFVLYLFASFLLNCLIYTLFLSFFIPFPYFLYTYFSSSTFCISDTSFNLFILLFFLPFFPFSLLSFLVCLIVSYLYRLVIFSLSFSFLNSMCRVQNMCIGTVKLLACS